MIIVRYADDIIVGFEHEADAHRFLEAMRSPSRIRRIGALFP
jgi:RNA-directed DNA polymerase